MNTNELITETSNRIDDLRSRLRFEERTLITLEKKWERENRDTPFKQAMRSNVVVHGTKTDTWKQRKFGWNACVNYILDECEGMCHEGGYLNKVLTEAKED